MGNMYTAPKKEGTYPFTRSGVAPPTTEKKSGSDKPAHKIHDPMSLEMHMADQRVRTAGMSPAEREWRAKWVQDQYLHPDEPVHVDAVHRQLNPIRIIYRYPLDTLFKRYLQPTFGTYYGTALRMFVPKMFMGIFIVQLMYYQWKYCSKDWQRGRGIGTVTIKPEIDNQMEIRKKFPGLMEEGMPDPAKYRYYDKSWDKRTTHFDLGEPNRKY